MAHPDHDQVIGRLAGARLRGTAERRSGGAATAESHPDAETWAAYVDGGLLADEVGSLETHLAACAVCRRLVAALVPEVSTAATPAVRSAEPPIAGPATIIPFPRRQVIAWMGIAAGLFGAVTLWSVSRLGRQAPVSEVAVATRPLSDAAEPAATRPAPAASAPPAGAGAVNPAEADDEGLARRKLAEAMRTRLSKADADKLTVAVGRGVQPPPAEAKRADAESAAAEARQIQLQTNAVAAGARPRGPLAAPANQQQNAPAAQQVGSPVPAPAPPAPAAPALAAPAAAAPAPTAQAPAPRASAAPAQAEADARERRANEQQVGQLTEVVTTTGAAGARPAAARSERGQAAGADRAGAASKDEAAKTLAFGAAAFVALPSFAEPGGRLQWRIAEGRRLESSSDGGATWRARYTARGDRLRAGTSPAIDSAWAVGERGLVLRFTVPGEWTAVARPAAVTLIAVSASGAQSARVTAADGRLFETADGGATWTPAGPGAGPQ